MGWQFAFYGADRRVQGPGRRDDETVTSSPPSDLDTAERVARFWGVSLDSASHLVGHRDAQAAVALLRHYLKPEAMPAVLRRPNPALADRSLHDLAAAGDGPGLLDACREMFDFRAVGDPGQ